MTPDYFQNIVDTIPSKASVLDLGCGNGELLEMLRKEKSIKGYGVDIDPKNILECIKRKISVFQGNINEGLKEFNNKSYDYVILSQTMQEVHNSVFVLSEMLRVGKKGIVTFPNFAYWQDRLQLLLGSAPKTRSLPYEWYETPNIRVVTIKEFKKLCRKHNIHIIKEIPLYKRTYEKYIFSTWLANIFCEQGMFVLEK